MKKTRTPIFWAKSILVVFFVLLLLAMALSPKMPLLWRLVSGAMGLILIAAGVKQFRSPKEEGRNSIVPVALLSLLYMLLGGCLFTYKIVSSDSVVADLFREPRQLLILAMFPIGVLALFLSILDITLHK